MNLEDGIDHYMARWAEGYGLFLVGMDLSMAELEIVAEKILDEHPNYEVTSQSPKVCAYRERRMGKRMVEYHHKTDKSIVAIMGNHHRRPKSEIHPILQSERIGYVCIYQPS